MGAVTAHRRPISQAAGPAGSITNNPGWWEQAKELALKVSEIALKLLLNLTTAAIVCICFIPIYLSSKVFNFIPSVDDILKIHDQIRSWIDKLFYKPPTPPVSPPPPGPIASMPRTLLFTIADTLAAKDLIAWFANYPLSIKVEFLKRNNQRVNLLLQHAKGRLSHLSPQWRQAFREVGATIQTLEIEQPVPRLHIDNYFSGRTHITNINSTLRNYEHNCRYNYAHEFKDIVNIFPNLTHLSIKNILTNDDVRELSKLKKLTHLTIKIVPSSSPLETVGTLTELQSLNIRIYSMDWRGLNAMPTHDLSLLHQLTRLKKLTLEGFKINQGGLDAIARNHQILEELALPACLKSRNNSLESIATIATLQKLDLSYCKYNDQSLSHFADHQALRHLTLRNFSQTTCHFPKELTHLRFASYLHDRTLLNNGTIWEITKRCKSLTTLDLCGRLITNDVLRYVAQLPALKELSISWCDATLDAESCELIAAMPLRVLGIADASVPRTGLMHLTRMTHLEELIIDKPFHFSNRDWLPLADIPTLKKFVFINFVGDKESLDPFIRKKPASIISD